MTLKELIRASITGEMEDITACETDAETFAAAGAVADYFAKLAVEKRERLPELRGIFREGTGFRQRKSVISRSVEAALRARIVRAETMTGVYSSLNRQMNKPEYKTVMLRLAARELEILAELRKLQASLKK